MPACLLCGAACSSNGRRFCCKAHYLEFGRIRARDRGRIKLGWFPQLTNCLVCRKEFMMKRRDNRYCSLSCRDINHECTQRTPAYLARQRERYKLKPKRKRDRRAYMQEYQAQPERKKRLRAWLKDYTAKPENQAKIKHWRQQAEERRKEKSYAERGYRPGELHLVSCRKCNSPFYTVNGLVCDHCQKIRQALAVERLLYRRGGRCCNPLCRQPLPVPRETKYQRYCSTTCQANADADAKILIKALEEFVDGEEVHRSGSAATRSNTRLSEAERRAQRNWERSNPGRKRKRNERRKRRTIRRQMLLQEARRIGLID